MRLLILGATGATGQQLVKQSLEQHHQVTVLVRDPSKLSVSHKNLTVIKGDILNKEILLSALEGTDAVISALGAGSSLKSYNLISNAVNTLVQAMNAKGINRLIFISAFGVGQTFKQANFFQKIIYRLFLKNIFADKEKGDMLIRNSNLEWTLVYPVVLTNGPQTGKYIAGEKLPMKGLPKISRADVAEFMLKQLTDKTYLHKSPIIMT
jgi:putative NADH-flavin reductase